VDIVEETKAYILITSEDEVTEMNIDFDGNGEIDTFAFQDDKNISAEYLTALFFRHIDPLDMQLSIKEQVVKKILSLERDNKSEPFKSNTIAQVAYALEIQKNKSYISNDELNLLKSILYQFTHSY